MKKEKWFETFRYERTNDVGRARKRTGEATEGSAGVGFTYFLRAYVFHRQCRTGVCEIWGKKKSRSRNWCGPANMNFTASNFLRRARVTADKTTERKKKKLAKREKLTNRNPSTVTFQIANDIYWSLQTNVDHSFHSHNARARARILICPFVSVYRIDFPLMAAVFSAMLGLIFMVKFMDEMNVVSRATKRNKFEKNNLCDAHELNECECGSSVFT